MKYNRYREGYEQHVVKNGYRNWILAEIVREGYRRGYYVLVLVKRLKHLKFLSKRLADVPHRIVAGTDYRGEKFVEKKGKLVRKVIGDKIEVKTRRKHIKRFEEGRIRVILANDVFKKGIDVKRLDVVIDGAAQKSKDDALQKFGRGVRLHPEKSGLIYFDLSDQDEHNKRNWFATAARSRKRAFTGARLTIREFEWKDDVEALYEKAERWLKKELVKTL